MPHSTPVNELLREYQTLFKQQGKPILDLACGTGHNGLYLHHKGFPVIFADKNNSPLASLKTQHLIKAEHCLNVDLETGRQVLATNSYQAIVVFRYLHRALIAEIKAAIEPGGLLIYETFTTENRQFGRPNRDDFLLQRNELKEMFCEWHCLHYFEGIKHNPDRAIAQIVCQKP